MTVDYRDPTHIMPTDSPVDQSKVSEANKTLAKWLRQKMYGVDVRESLARLAEQTSADVYDDRQTVLDYTKIMQTTRSKRCATWPTGFHRSLRMS